MEINHLSAELPSDTLRKLPLLRNLQLSFNNIGSDYDDNTYVHPNFTALEENLDLASMGIGGTLPGSISRIDNLTQLSLIENQITGSITPFIANISNLMLLIKIVH